jgi:hypothetical protein
VKSSSLKASCGVSDTIVFGYLLDKPEIGQRFGARDPYRLAEAIFPQK